MEILRLARASGRQPYMDQSWCSRCTTSLHRIAVVEFVAIVIVVVVVFAVVVIVIEAVVIVMVSVVAATESGVAAAATTSEADSHELVALSEPRTASWCDISDIQCRRPRPTQHIQSHRSPRSLLPPAPPAPRLSLGIRAPHVVGPAVAPDGRAGS